MRVMFEIIGRIVVYGAMVSAATFACLGIWTAIQMLPYAGICASLGGGC